MKRASFFICFLFICAFIPLVSTETLAFKPEDFQFSAKFQEPVNIDSLYKEHLSEEVFRESGPGFKDLRILDQNNNEIPYVILPAVYSRSSAQQFQLKIIDFKKRKDAIVITIELPKEASNLSSIDLNTPNRDFTKKIEIEGSSDRKKWHRVISDMVYDLSTQVDLRKTAFNLDNLPYRYYRLTIEDVQFKGEQSKNMELQYNGLHFTVNEPETTRNFRINGITGVFIPPSAIPDEYDEHSFKDFTIDQDKEGNSVILLDAGLPVQTMNLIIQNPYFFRGIKVYSSFTPDKDGPWVFRGNYSVFKFNFDGISKLQTSLLLSSEQTKYYKLVIENKNNPVLKIDEIQVKWPRHYLFFSGLEKNATYTLYFGSPMIQDAPQYDLSKFVRRDNWSSLKTISIPLSPIEKRPQFNPTPPEIKEEIKSKKGISNIWEVRILYGVVFFGVLVMGIWLYKLLRDLPPKRVD